MKPFNHCRRKISLCWKLALGFSLMFGVPDSQAASPSVYYMNLTLQWGKWAMSEIYHPALFEENLPSKKMVGVLVIPEGEAKNACGVETNFNIPPNTKDWIAFIARGGCTFKDKVMAAAQKGATGVIIYDHSCAERESLILTREDAGEIAAVMISSLKGKQILRLIQEGIRVTAMIELGATQCLWKIYLCAYSLILTFVAYILICCTPGQIMVRHEERRAQMIKSELRKAVHSLELRKLKKDEFDLAEETCVVCLETYKPREIVRILTCRHIFHKRCIDRWLLKRGICPICNYAIIQGN